MEQRIGPQSIDITGDTAFITMVDEVLAEDMAVLLAALDTVGGGDGPFYILADIRRLRILPPPARHLAGAWKGIGRVGGTAIIGATLITKTLVMLASRASTLLSNTRKTGEVRFFNSEEDARAWIATRRGTLRTNRIRL